MSLVRLDDVSLAYGEQKLLVHVGFEIDPGERVCLIGRNGTGKTTLLHLIVGNDHPDSGIIARARGRRIWHAADGFKNDSRTTQTTQLQGGQLHRT